MLYIFLLINVLLFQVTAKGCPDVPLCWLFDAQLSLAKLAGRLCGTTLDVSKGIVD